MVAFVLGVREYQTECSLPLQDGSSTAAVASVVLMVSVNGHALTIVALPKSSFADWARAGDMFSNASSSPAALTTTSLAVRSRRIVVSFPGVLVGPSRENVHHPSGGPRAARGPAFGS